MTIRRMIATDAPLLLRRLAELPNPPYYPGDSVVSMLIEHPDWVWHVKDDDMVCGFYIDRRNRQATLVYLLPGLARVDYQMEIAGYGFRALWEEHPETHGWPWEADLSGVTDKRDPRITPLQHENARRAAAQFFSPEAVKLNAYDGTAFRVRGMLEHAAAFHGARGA